MASIDAPNRSPHRVVCFALCVACGPQSGSHGETDPTTTVTATDGASDSDTSDHTSTETDGVTATDTDTDETDGDQLCDPPVDDEPGPSTATITIRNDSDEPRFIAPWSPFGCNYAKVEILVDGESLHWDHDRVYPYACDECGWGCSDGGDMGLLINPGATAEVPWNGAAWMTTELSEACALEVCEEGVTPFECEVRRDLGDVEYVARAHIYDACPDGVADDACVCEQDVCEVFFYEPGMGQSTAEASATFPAGATIVLE